jgi:hypothetical protein
VSTNFIEVTTTTLTGTAAAKGPKIVLAASHLVMVRAGKNNSSGIMLIDGTKLNVADSYDVMKQKLGMAP